MTSPVESSSTPSVEGGLLGIIIGLAQSNTGNTGGVGASSGGRGITINEPGEFPPSRQGKASGSSEKLPLRESVKGEVSYTPPAMWDNGTDKIAIYGSHSAAQSAKTIGQQRFLGYWGTCIGKQ